MSKPHDKESGERDSLSLHPLELDEAMAGFLQVDPKKVKEAEHERQHEDENDTREDR